MNFEFCCNATAHLSLRPQLFGMPGFLENNRYRSRSRPGWLLSLSLGDDEKALVRWRTVEKHHRAQTEGRDGVLCDDRIRVGEVTQVSGAFPQRSVDWMRQDITQVGQAQALIIIDGVLPPDSIIWKLAGPPAHPYAGMVSQEVFEHLALPDHIAMLIGWRTQQQAALPFEAAISHHDRHTHIYAIRVIRDYGMKDRREAPQYFRPAHDGPAAP
jgi:heme-degrading monooxygenase HmoA